MSELPVCPKCASTFTYEDRDNFVCPDCAHEWTAATADVEADAVARVTDANGTLLQNGDSVIVTKDLKLKGSSLVVKVGTKVRNIRLVEGDHDIDCRLDGVGAIQLKSAFVRKA